MLVIVFSARCLSCPTMFQNWSESSVHISDMVSEVRAPPDFAVSVSGQEPSKRGGSRGVSSGLLQLTVMENGLVDRKQEGVRRPKASASLKAREIQETAVRDT